jgi:hypothetical protein
MADLDTKAAAELLGMSAEWLRKQAAARLVPHNRYGRSVRFTAEQVAQIRAMSAQPIASVPDLGAIRRRRASAGLTMPANARRRSA